MYHIAPTLEALKVSPQYQPSSLVLEQNFTLQPSEDLTGFIISITECDIDQDKWLEGGWMIYGFLDAACGAAWRSLWGIMSWHTSSVRSVNPTSTLIVWAFSQRQR